MRNSFEIDGHQVNAVAAADAAEATRLLGQITSGNREPSYPEEEFDLIMRMGAGLEALKMEALLEDPEKYARHFLND